jgi:hypothetical protein
MFPCFEGRHIPHILDFIIDHLTTSDLILLKLVSKEWATNISRYIRRRVASGELAGRLDEAWKTPIDKATTINLPKRLGGIQKCEWNGKILSLSADWNLVECSPNFTELSRYTLNGNHHMNYSSRSWAKQVGALLLVFTKKNLQMFEWEKGQYWHRAIQHDMFFTDSKNIVFNGKFVVVKHWGRGTFIFEVDLPDKNLNKWDQSDNPMCLKTDSYLLSAVDECSGNFAILTTEKIYILNGQNLREEGSFGLCSGDACSPSFLKKHPYRLKLEYYQSILVMVCPCQMVIWNLGTDPIPDSPEHILLTPNPGDMVTDLTITRESVIVYVVINASDPWKTRVCRFDISSPRVWVDDRNRTDPPMEIMKLESRDHPNLLVFDTRIILYNKERRAEGNYDHVCTMVVGDVWNQDSVQLEEEEEEEECEDESNCLPPKKKILRHGVC